jgi:hypothetical protein
MILIWILNEAPGIFKIKTTPSLTSCPQAVGEGGVLPATPDRYFGKAIGLKIIMKPDIAKWCQ